MITHAVLFVLSFHHNRSDRLSQCFRWSRANCKMKPRQLIGASWEIWGLLKITVKRCHNEYQRRHHCDPAHIPALSFIHLSFATLDNSNYMVCPIVRHHFHHSAHLFSLRNCEYLSSEVNKVTKSIVLRDNPAIMPLACPNLD